MTWFADAAQWYLVSLAAGLAFAPLTYWLGRRLPGQAVWCIRPLGLLALVWPAWFLSSISPFPFSTTTLWFTLGLGALLCWIPAIRLRTIERSWWRLLLMTEAIFLVAFSAFLIYKGFTPRITGTEKPMDVGFLAATMRATSMPPPDQWMAGEPINYYYLGYLLNGVLARLTGLPSWVAYNLALASTFAMTIVAAIGLAGALATKLRAQRSMMLAAAIGGFLVVISGNLRTIVRLLENPRGTWDAFYFQGPGWEASRVVVDHGWPLGGETINEFPSFSFVLGDLHPHVTALPITLVGLSLAIGFVFRSPQPDLRRWQMWAELATAGAIVGALYPLNSWDYPTYLGAAALGLLLSSGFTTAFVAQVVGLGAASILAWAPFWLRFVPFSGSDTIDAPNIPGLHFLAKNVAGYSGPWTSVSEYLTIFGIQWMIALIYLIVETVLLARDQAVAPLSTEVRRGLFLGGGALAFLALVLPAPVLLLAGLPMVMALHLLVRLWSTELPGSLILPALYVAAWGTTILTEFFYIRDIFQSRFNTLFKIYYQVWTLLSIAGAVALALIWQRTRHNLRLRTAMTLAIGLMGVAGLSYPVVGIHAWTGFTQINPDRSWQGFDGLEQHGRDPGVEPAILAGVSPDDVAAIRWLNDHAQEGDILLEAPGCQYEIAYELPTSRFSAFTGIPTVIGWQNAEGQWRGGQPELEASIPARQDDVAAMYADPNPTTNPLFDRYGITLLVVGDLERYGTDRCSVAGPYPAVETEGYPGPGWTRVYSGGGTHIYRRERS